MIWIIGTDFRTKVLIDEAKAFPGFLSILLKTGCNEDKVCEVL
jgi:hypothetical protein